MLFRSLQLGQVTANCGRRDLELAGQLLDTNYMIHPQDLSEPLDAFRGEFSWLAGFQFVTVNAVLVMLSPFSRRGGIRVDSAKHLCSLSRSHAMLNSD